MTQGVVRQRVRGVTRGNRRENVRCAIATHSQGSPDSEQLQSHMISVFHNSRDSHTLLQDATVQRPVRFGTA